MEIKQAQKILAEQHRAVLATLRRDGSPQLSPVLTALDDDGTVLVSTRETAFKTRNLRRNPSLWLCVLSDGFFGRWVQVAGTADIVELPAAMPGLERHYRLISGEHENWDEYRAAMHAERRVLLRVTITAAGPDRIG